MIYRLSKVYDCYFVFFRYKLEICYKIICYRYLICILCYICYYVICECIFKCYCLVYILVYILLDLRLLRLNGYGIRLVFVLAFVAYFDRV